MNESLLLKKFFPTKASVAAEIINLQAILNLPKGTEHFLSDLHGEYETFTHILKNASGVIRSKIADLYKNLLTKSQMDSLATLVYYPDERIKIAKVKHQQNLFEWYKMNLIRLVELCKIVSSKYTRSKVRKALPADFQYIIDELIHVPEHKENKESYYENIFDSIIELGEADRFIIGISDVIKKLSIDRLHIVGDIFDRGNGADIIIDELMRYHAADLQWGNHDIMWIGAHLGNTACIANVLRINCMYNNLHTLENGYGINLRQLALHASKHYAQDLKNFEIKSNYANYDIDDKNLLTKMHKAVSVLQMKLESALCDKHPEFIPFGGKPNLKAANIDPNLSDEEAQIVAGLKRSFTDSARLSQHIRFILEKGSLYKCFNGNLLMHGCVPTDPDGQFTEVTVKGQTFSGKALYDRLNQLVQCASRDEYALDYLWYLWCGKNSPLYGRDSINTFEKYFLGQEEKEEKNAYYRYICDEAYCRKILCEFGLDGDKGHIINGHMPVKVKAGENPVGGGGKHITIDGGMSLPYRDSTGIAGYTLISNSQGLMLAAHSPFKSIRNAIEEKGDIESKITVVEWYPERVLVRDTDIGKELTGQIEILKSML